MNSETIRARFKLYRQQIKELEDRVPPKKSRPKKVPGSTTRVETGCDRLYVQVNVLDGRIFEVFCTKGRNGECGRAFVEALTRCITAGLRRGIPVEDYIKQLEQIRCNCPSMGEDKVLSCPEGIRQVLIIELARLEGING